MNFCATCGVTTTCLSRAPSMFTSCGSGRNSKPIPKIHAISSRSTAKDIVSPGSTCSVLLLLEYQDVGNLLALRVGEVVALRHGFAVSGNRSSVNGNNSAILLLDDSHRVTIDPCIGTRAGYSWSYMRTQRCGQCAK